MTPIELVDTCLDGALCSDRRHDDTVEHCRSVLHAEFGGLYTVIGLYPDGALFCETYHVIEADMTPEVTDGVKHYLIDTGQLDTAIEVLAVCEGCLGKPL